MNMMLSLVALKISTPLRSSCRFFLSPRATTLTGSDSIKLLSARGTSHRMASNDETFEENFQGTRLFVRNIPFDVNWGQLKDFFNAADAGTVVYASISVDMVTRQSKGCGIVQFDTTGAAQKAFETMNGRAMGDKGHLLDIRFDIQEREKRELSKTQNGFTTKGQNPNPKTTFTPIEQVPTDVEGNRVQSPRFRLPRPEPKSGSTLTVRSPFKSAPTAPAAAKPVRSAGTAGTSAYNRSCLLSTHPCPLVHLPPPPPLVPLPLLLSPPLTHPLTYHCRSHSSIYHCHRTLSFIPRIPAKTTLSFNYQCRHSSPHPPPLLPPAPPPLPLPPYPSPPTPTDDSDSDLPPPLSVRQKRALGTPLTPMARAAWAFDAVQSESVSAAEQAAIHAVVLER